MIKKEIGTQGLLFEDDYLIRTLGSLGNSPEVALTELVANAWDAGATNVDIFIPEEKGQKLTISDNGIGLTKDEFFARWMKLGYNRLKHQGEKVEFPKGVELQRNAYGRNGVGRHGLLCFNNEYRIITHKGGVESIFTITTKSKNDPFIVKKKSFKKSTKSGTRLEVIVEKNLPKPDQILEIISARFLHDPQFRISINKQTIQFEDLKGIVDVVTIEVQDCTLRINLIDTVKSRKSTLYQGIAIWQGGRLVGEPSWILGKNMVLDGRSRQAKRYSIVVQTDDLSDYITEDWTGFKKSNILSDIFDAITSCVQSMFLKIAEDNIEETTAQIKKEYKSEYENLGPLAKYEFNEAIQHISVSNPTASQESISLALETVIQLEKTRSGNQLLQKILTLSADDIDGLNKLLDNWSVKDALTVLDEIDKRISVIEAIRKLSGDSTIDELHILHPLIASARWIFGPEFDSPEFSFNNQLHTTVNKVFGKNINKDAFVNPRKRPDIVVIGDSTFSFTSTVTFDNEISSLNKILIIELKRGGYKIGRDERNQAVGYVEDIIGCGAIIGNPYINAFVVGETFSDKAQPTQTIKDGNDIERGKVQICLFSQIVDSSEKRLFSLRSKLNDRYSDISGIELFERQQKLPI
ncbi:MAG TPA: ATP-binding protein [Paludibacter sp.]